MAAMAPERRWSTGGKPRSGERPPSPMREDGGQAHKPPFWGTAADLGLSFQLPPLGQSRGVNRSADFIVLESPSGRCRGSAATGVMGCHGDPPLALGRFGAARREGLCVRHGPVAAGP